MNLNDYVTITSLPDQKDYKLAEKGLGFVVGGMDFLASLSPSEPARYVAILRFVEGEVRGNHYHRKKLEQLVALDGTIRGKFFDPDDTSNQITIDVEAGQMLTIKPGCAHAFTSLTPSACMLELSPQELDLADQINC